jgi:hypothetical protein
MITALAIAVAEPHFANRGNSSAGWYILEKRRCVNDQLEVLAPFCYKTAAFRTHLKVNVVNVTLKIDRQHDVGVLSQKSCIAPSYINIEDECIISSHTFYCGLQQELPLRILSTA